jgi:hypothetical protein
LFFHFQLVDFISFAHFFIVRFLFPSKIQAVKYLLVFPCFRSLNVRSLLQENSGHHTPFWVDCVSPEWAFNSEPR